MFGHEVDKIFSVFNSRKFHPQEHAPSRKVHHHPPSTLHLESASELLRPIMVDCLQHMMLFIEFSVAESRFVVMLINTRAVLQVCGLVRLLSAS